MIENKKKEKIWKSKNFFLHKSRSNKWFSNGIHNEQPEGALTSFTVCDAYRYYH